jgi:hypothetical protein
MPDRAYLWAPHRVPAVEWTTVTVTVPKDINDRLGELVRGSGVSLDGFVAASMERRCQEHEGKSELVDWLAERSRAFDEERARDSGAA